MLFMKKVGAGIIALVILSMFPVFASAQCTQPCQTSNDCPIDKQCSSGCCAPISCSQNSDCPFPCPSPASVFSPTAACNICTNGFCVDPDPCTTNAGCSGSTPICRIGVGGCPGGTGSLCCGQCQNDAQCDQLDTNPCTTGDCQPNGSCLQVNNANACDDGNACTSADACSGGACSGTPVVCNDGNPCTDDSCNPATGCVFTNNVLPCADDGNSCTNDVCGGGACTHPFNTDPCNDGNACTLFDTCSGGSCLGVFPLICDDENICTDDSCDPQTGCIFPPNSAPCDDFNACTIGDTCGGGFCQPGSPLNCDDGLFCNGMETCDPLLGCLFGMPPDCDDLISCTIDECDENTDSCTHQANDAACNDGVCCTFDVCDAQADCMSTLDDDDGDLWGDSSSPGCFE